jgi:prepilin-type N-terminal cleavage/methylation domain-containing protein/prepilin-type processing-associated H-X9-DG protein
MSRSLRTAASPARPNRAADVAGFSLLELLLVLGLILILASLYWRSTSNGQQRQQGRNCEKNLQKIFIAMEIFAADHGGKYPDVPGARTSSEALDGLVPRYTVDTGAFVCPASKDAALPAGEAIAKRKISYAYYMGRRHSDTAEVLMSDQQVNVLAKIAGQLAFSATGDAPGNNHQKTGGNFLFGDGHTEPTPARVPFSLVFTQGIVLLNP